MKDELPRDPRRDGRTPLHQHVQGDRWLEFSFIQSNQRLLLLPRLEPLLPYHKNSKHPSYGHHMSECTNEQACIKQQSDAVPGQIGAFR